MKMQVSVSGALVCIAALTSCRTAPEFPNAPPDVVEDCRRQVVVMTERDPGLATEPLPDRTTEQGEDVIGDARAAREEAEVENLSTWPEEILLYRCLAARGVELAPEQARELAAWESGLERNP